MRLFQKWPRYGKHAAASGLLLSLTFNSAVAVAATHTRPVGEEVAERTRLAGLVERIPLAGEVAAAHTRPAVAAVRMRLAGLLVAHTLLVWHMDQVGTQHCRSD